MWTTVSPRCVTSILKHIRSQYAALPISRRTLHVLRPTRKLCISGLVACGVCAGALAGYCTVPRTCLASSVAPSSAMSLGRPITTPDGVSNSTNFKMEVISIKTQAEVVHELQRLEGSSKKFVVNRSTDSDNSGSITCVIEDGEVFEKACVNVAVSSGVLPADAAKRMRMSTHKDGPLEYSATIITSTIHPRNPNAPSIQFSYSYFEASDSSGVVHWWFDGGCELTPYILHEEDIRHFHRTLKQTCDRHNVSYYRAFKEQCDKHYFIKHRQEHRGVGGIYFDHLNDGSQIKCLEFVSDCLRAVLPSYVPIVEKNKDKGYSYCDRDLQLVRQARFAEFTLLYDSDEYSDLMLPLNARWHYQSEHKASSGGNDIFDILRNPKDWV
ncbi:oxygen-dependent coproporphyrinogen-III oxidase-like [Ornithodoros turicata]|uniref:oxygen-dependent coproporphyrinogen-III oxidase-like n=1 Tax=Ornithodoros turicata TaxID=34597 RepID=UPI003139B351